MVTVDHQGLVWDRTPNPCCVPAPAWIDETPPSKTANITVNYHPSSCAGTTPWTNEARATFQMAVDIWSAILNGNQSIEIAHGLDFAGRMRVDDGKVNHHPGEVTLGILQDLGWDLRNLNNVWVDASNTSGVEVGSVGRPFNTVFEGVSAVYPSATVYVAGGSDPDRGNERVGHRVDVARGAPSEFSGTDNLLPE